MLPDESEATMRDGQQIYIAGIDDARLSHDRSTGCPCEDEGVS
jgi:hypothetical protein